MILDVPVAGGSYPVHVVRGGLDGLGEAMAGVLPPGPAVVVTNPVVGALYLDAALASLEAAGFAPRTVEIPDGEVHKTVETWHRLVEDLLAVGVDRTTPVVALGGGVTGDVAGFAAATVLRGVPLVQVPTSLLAMVDSAVGGKTGVNSPRGKNLVGAFHQPRLVYAAMSVLSTLDEAEMRCGLGEVVKHGVIRDPELFEFCASHAESIRARDADAMAVLVERSCRVKAAVVAADEREQGLRSILNFGHTVGHAVETALGHGHLRHGECVAIGMVAEARWAASQGYCRAEVPEAVAQVLIELGMPVGLPEAVDLDRLRAAASFDKKVARGTLRTAVLERIGRVRLERIPVADLSVMLAHLTGNPED